MFKMLFNIIFSIVLIFISIPSMANTVLFADDFEKGEDSQIYQYLTAHGFSVEIVPKVGGNNSKALKVKYVSIFKGSSRVKGFFKLARKSMEVSLSFDVYFNNDFQFVKGGKLHGVGPDFPITGGRKLQPHGWSSRVMFRKEGRVETYLYTQDKNQQFGAQRQNETFHFRHGKYYAVTLYTRLNSSHDKPDGEARIYIDGKLLVTHDKAYFWSDPVKDSRISQFLFTTFHGGATSAWSPKDKNGNHLNVHATFDNFIVTEGLKIRQSPGTY